MCVCECVLQSDQKYETSKHWLDIFWIDRRDMCVCMNNRVHHFYCRTYNGMYRHNWLGMDMPLASPNSVHVCRACAAHIMINENRIPFDGVLWISWYFAIHFALFPHLNVLLSKWNTSNICFLITLYYGHRNVYSTHAYFVSIHTAVNCVNVLSHFDQILFHFKRNRTIFNA